MLLAKVYKVFQTTKLFIVFFFKIFVILSRYNDFSQEQCYYRLTFSTTKVWGKEKKA